MVGQSLVEIGPVILEKIFKIFVNVLLLFPFYLHSVKSIIHMNKPKFPLPKDSLWQVWVKLAPWFWRKFLYFVNVFFCYFVTIFPLEKGHSPSFEKNPQTLIPLTQGWIMLWAMFGWNWPSGSGEDFQILSIYTCPLLFPYHLPLKRLWPFIW